MASYPRKSTAAGFSKADAHDTIEKMVIGARLKLEHVRNEEKLNFNGVLVGMSIGECLIIRVFANQEILERLTEGEPIFAWYVTKGNAYAFDSTIISSIIKPALMVFLDYPDEVKTWNIRQAQRVPCGFSATVKTQTSEHRAVIVNISAGGCKLCMDNSGGEPLCFETGQRITLCFYVTEEAKDLRINSTVQYVRRDAEFMEMGVEFDTKNNAGLSAIKHYVAGMVHKFGQQPY